MAGVEESIPLLDLNQTGDQAQYLNQDIEVQVEVELHSEVSIQMDTFDSVSSNQNLSLKNLS